MALVRAGAEMAAVVGSVVLEGAVDGGDVVGA